MEKYCPRCKFTKELSEFYKSKNQYQGVTGWCKSCTNEQRKNKRDSDPEYRALANDKRSASRYGMSVEQYREMLAGGCEACGSKVGKMCIDHDHNCCPSEFTCGRCIRGVLCGACNTAEGLLRSPENAVALAMYMMKFVNTFEIEEV